MGTLHVIKDLDAVWNHQWNLLDTSTGRVVLDPPANGITRIQIVPGRTFFLLHYYENMNDNRVCILDENGKNIFRNEYRYIGIWQEPEVDKPCILEVRKTGEKGCMLIDTDENPLSEVYDAIDKHYCYSSPYVKVTKDEKISYVTYPEFKSVTPLWFDAKCNDDRRWQKFRGNEDFVSIVKYKGRYQALMRDGSLQKA